MIGRFLAAGTWTAPTTNDDGAFGPYGSGQTYMSQSGQEVSAESALRIGAVFSAVNLLSDTLAQLPVHLFDRLPNDQGKKRSDMPLDRLISRQPNEEQSSVEFMLTMQSWASVRDYAYAEKLYEGSQLRGLMPRHPERVRVETLSDGSYRYAYLEGDGNWRPILRDDMFRVPGKPVLRYATEAIGMAQSIQSYGATSFRRGVRPGGLISTDPNATYTDAAKQKLADEIMSEHGGSQRAGGLLMLPEGLKWHQLGMTNEQAEMVATSVHSVTEIARYFGLPPYRLGVTSEGSMSFASVEMQSLELVVYTVMPWVRRWEGAYMKDIVMGDDQFVEFLVQALLRGTTKERYEAYAIALQWGWLTVEEVRRLESLNTTPGWNESAVPPPGMAPPPDQMDEDSPAARMAQMLAGDAATQLVNKEVRAMRRAADMFEKHGIEPYEEQVNAFYEGHGPFIAEKLHAPLGEGLAYARQHRDALLTDGPTVLDAWDTARLADGLTTMALSEATA